MPATDIDWDHTLAFDTPDAEFARGFDIGKVWGRLQFERPAEADVMILAANVEMLMRVANVAGYTFTATERGADHLDVHLVRKDSL